MTTNHNLYPFVYAPEFLRETLNRLFTQDPYHRVIQVFLECHEWIEMDAEPQFEHYRTQLLDAATPEAQLEALNHALLNTLEFGAVCGMLASSASMGESLRAMSQYQGIKERLGK